MKKNERQTAAVIPAGGAGCRMGTEKGKLLLPLGEGTVIGATLQAMDLPEIEAFFIPVSPAVEAEIREIVRVAGMLGKVHFCPGGANRQESVYSGLSVAGEWPGWRLPEEQRIIVIHDAARPLVGEQSIKECIAVAQEQGAACLGVPVKDTIKVVDKEGYIRATPERNSLWAIQTPQVFVWPVIWQAHLAARAEGFTGTDDASLVERIKQPVRLVQGAEENIKITTPVDLKLAEAVYADRLKGRCGVRPPKIRVGQGYDVHRLVAGRRLILGGVAIPAKIGLEGHSDADVATHALIDALLGAAGMADIGELFPDSDDEFKDIDSLVLLHRVITLLKAAGVKPVSADLTIIAQHPKLAPYRSRMRENLAQALSLPVEDINVKATTTEGLGFTGRGEGIASQAVVLVEKA